MTPLELARRDFAEMIRATADVRSERLVQAFASVPREHFVGPGPWKVAVDGGYEVTPDANPRHLYENVVVAVDARRNLNNGEPAFLARCLDGLALTPGDRVLHVGCGVGYYTAIMAETVTPGGRVVAVEVDRELAARARRNLIAWRAAEVVSADGSEFEAEPFDAIFVNAGATEVRSLWLDHLRSEGRLVLPLTVATPTHNVGAGQMLLVERRARGYGARFISTVGIFHCAGARTTEGNDLLDRAYETGGHEDVMSLRRDEHPPDPQCWLHASHFCLSRSAVDAKP